MFGHDIMDNQAMFLCGALVAFFAFAPRRPVVLVLDALNGDRKSPPAFVAPKVR